MPEPRTWRELLGQIIENRQERQQISEALKISPITLTRWAQNESVPRSSNLQQLLNALPQHYTLLLQLIREEFPEFAEAPTEDEAEQEIPSEFYAEVLRICTRIGPQQRFWAVAKPVAEQAMLQLDPYQFGLLISVMRCLPPRPGNKVRSLYASVGQGTPPWEGSYDQWPILVGIESMAGYAATNYRTIVVQDLEKESGFFPIRTFDKSGKIEKLEEARSICASPILREESTAGSLFLCSTQLRYFTPSRLALIQQYVELLALAFEPGEFYGKQRIDLGIMPSLQVQEPYFAKFKQRVYALMAQATRDGQPVTVQQAELMAWQELEEEFIRLNPGMKQ